MERDRTLLLEPVVIQSVPEGILLLDEGGKLIYANAKAKELLGWGEIPYGSRSLEEVCPAKGGNEAFFTLAGRILAGEEKEEAQNCIYTTGSQTRWLRISWAAQEEETGKRIYILIFSDISSLIALQQENRRIAYDTLEVMHNFVRVMVTAIDARSAYNANHTRSMFRYARRFFAWTRGEGKDISVFADTEPEPFLCSVWLHDIGKLGIPSEILDKPTRLGEGLEAVLHRIDVGILQEEIVSLKTGEDTSLAVQELKKVREDILRINQGGPLDEEAIRRVEEIGTLTYRGMDGRKKPLLTPREREDLLITTGTLNGEERKRIESHVNLSEKMLRQMRFAGTYAKVPLWSGGHHELLDGSGYPRHLKGEQIPKETRLLTILDIFDALTAEDRPYKPPISVPEAFCVLWDMVRQGKLDGEILAEFEKSRAWERKTIRDMDYSELTDAALWEGEMNGPERS